MPGEVVVIEGRSGSGKSTLCQLIAGLEAPDHGRVPRRRACAAVSVRDWARLALLPQRLGLPAELTVAENVSAARAGCGGCPARPELLEAFDLTHLADNLTGQASRGEQQRVAIARAAVLGPVVIVLDEPTSHQDEAHADLVAHQLLELARAGSAVLVATHDPRLVSEADRVVHLHAGRHRGSPDASIAASRPRPFSTWCCKVAVPRVTVYWLLVTLGTGAVMDDLTELLKGVLEGAVLQVLARGSNHGYDIVKALNQVGFTSVAEGTVYPILMRLEKKRLVEVTKVRSELGPPRKVYSLNADGRAALDSFWLRWDFVATRMHSIKENES